MTNPANLPIEEEAAKLAWGEFLHKTVNADGQFSDAWIDTWDRSNGPTGPVLSARVDGPDALEAVRRFTTSVFVTFSSCGARREPTLDYAVAGREACVWQSGGVWLELWAPDEVPAAPEPAQAPATPKPAPPLTSSKFAARLFGPSGRLPIRRSKTKETTTR